MTTLLAIESTSNRRFNGCAPAVSHKTGRSVRDAIEDRPPIPRTTIDWPIGVGDPATDVSGSRPFRVIEVTRSRRLSFGGLAIEALVVGILFVGVLTIVGARFGTAAETARAMQAPDAAPLVAKVPHVEVRVVDVRPAKSALPTADPAADQQPTSAARG